MFAATTRHEANLPCELSQVKERAIRDPMQYNLGEGVALYTLEETFNDDSPCTVFGIPPCASRTTDGERRVALK